ncbi:hypothetical protein, partial [Yersinia pestis]|uniref:hypothetical protein n=1 Tax=Yersinia pestis TaxID=632 RepID=UPI00036434A0
SPQSLSYLIDWGLDTSALFQAHQLIACLTGPLDTKFFTHAAWRFAYHLRCYENKKKLSRLIIAV